MLKQCVNFLFPKENNGINRAKTLVEICAIIFAGILAYNKFIGIERPLFNPSFTGGASVSWEKTTEKKRCFAHIKVNISNVGKVAFLIKKVRLRVWIINNIKNTSDVTIYDFTKFDDTCTPHEFILNNTLVRTYDIGCSASATYSLNIFKKPGNILYYKVDALIEPNNHNGNYTVIGYGWSYINNETGAS